MSNITHDLRASSLKKSPQTLRTPRRAIKFLTLAAARSIGKVTKDCNILGATKGQFSAIDMIDHVLDFTGKADVTLTMWSANDAGIFRLVNMRSSGKIGKIRLVMDPSFFARKPEFYQTLVDNFGPEEIRTLNCHAKFATISNAEWNIAIRTSMNLTHNPRMEIFEITDSLDICGFFNDLVDEIFSFESITILSDVGTDC